MGTTMMRVVALAVALLATVANTAVVTQAVGVQPDAEGAAESAIRLARVSSCARFIEEQQDITAVLYFLKQGPEASFNEKAFCTQMIARGMSHDSTNCHAIFSVAKNDEGLPLTL